MNKLTHIVFFMIFVMNSVFGQLHPHKLSLNIDAGTPMQTWLDGSEGYSFVSGVEYSINDVFSIEGMYNYDKDNYRAFSNDYGLGASQASRYEPYSNLYQEGYIGIRLYPEENYHSQALNLRRKKNYGWYFSFGYGGYSYKRKNYNFEHYQHNEWDTTLNQNIVHTDSVFLHKHGYTIRNRGVQFGFGWKQYHSKFYYTELGVQSSAYVRENRATSFWKEEDPRRTQITPYYRDDLWDNYTDHVGFFSKNGRGLFLRFTLGVNLDLRR